MKYLLLTFLAFIQFAVSAQMPARVNPVIKTQGGVFEIPYAEEKPDPSIRYKIVIEVERQSEKPDTINWALNNVARLLNLHAIGGVPSKSMEVVLAIHAELLTR